MGPLRKSANNETQTFVRRSRTRRESEQYQDCQNAFVALALQNQSHCSATTQSEGARC